MSQFCDNNVTYQFMGNKSTLQPFNKLCSQLYWQEIVVMCNLHCSNLWNFTFVHILQGIPDLQHFKWNSFNSLCSFSDFIFLEIITYHMYIILQVSETKKFDWERQLPVDSDTASVGYCFWIHCIKINQNKVVAKLKTFVKKNSFDNISSYHFLEWKIFHVQ